VLVKTLKATVSDVEQHQSQFGNPKAGGGILALYLCCWKARVAGRASQLVGIDPEGASGGVAFLGPDCLQQAAIRRG
jgi:hypothetical protein